jgi:hypothetical protein
MQKLTASKIFDILFGGAFFIAPALYASYHAKHHKSVEIDLIFFVVVSIVGTLSLIQKTLTGILEKMSKPMTMKIVDKTIDMGDVDILIKSREN